MVTLNVGFGDDFDYNAVVYGENHPNVLNYLENKISRFDSFSQTLTDAGRSFMSNVKDLYENVNGSEAMRVARAAIRKAGSMFQRDEIKSIWELTALQTAPPTMQRWIMANPVVREMYHQQRCDGYSDTYVDMHPGVIGKDHYDYRRAMHGMMVDEDDGWKVTFYLDDLVDGDRELVLSEKTDILNTWDIVSAIMKAGKEDPTSVYGSKL